ncbi:MAG TPA: DUF1553 domain-containing protein [Verrucomicrobiales bacterium]|nr:DUF1553 domain-containing protein [Verrucomicrobiales bacterium]
MITRALLSVAIAWPAALISAAEPPPFRTAVLPVLTKAGCNAGACHGAATGQGGFQLSLLGYDPREDFDRITREFGGRRIDLDQPGHSLLLRKSSYQIEHEGGRKLPRDSSGHALLLRWIARGAPYGPAELRVTGIEVDPRDSLIQNTGESVQLRVTASLSNGVREDVTPLALYTSNDDAVAEVSKSGTVSVTGRGLTSIMVRYSGQVAAARIAAPLGGPNQEILLTPAANFIDEHIDAELLRLRVPPSSASGDAEFLRRVHLDLAGLLPASEAARTFLAEPPSAEKRLRVIETLLASPAFVDLWTMKLADLLLLKGGSEEAAAYHHWLRNQVAANAPLDRVARALLTTTGELTSAGPANFLTLANDPRDLSEHVSRIFLGTQLACARCHSHPSDRWTREDYHHFAAFFARITREGGAIHIAARGEVDHPSTGEPLPPKPLGAPLPQDAGDDSRLAGLSRWLTAPDNPFFARSFVNWVWMHLLGRGLVEPVDDFRPTNPPTHPALLDALAADFVANGFDLRHLVRTIVSSHTYQRTSRSLVANKSDTHLYSHAFLKEIPAPVFADAVAQVTGVPDVFEGYTAGVRAVQLVSPATPSPALDVLGRCLRTGPCDGPSQLGGGLAKALHLINGPTINAKLRHGAAGALRDRSSRDAIEEVYLRAFSRAPKPVELAEWNVLLDRAPNRSAAFEDFLWTLLNSREFAFNR